MSIQKVISNAVSHKGYKEGANNDNIFAGIAGHANHQPWCATFVVACFKEGGELAAVPDSASCEYIETWGNKMKRTRTKQTAKRGDLILFDFSKSGKAQHVGIAVHDYDLKTNTIQTIEGNTGDVNQANGDGVYVKTRQLEFIRAVIRPVWSDPNEAK
jgi:hypothetical protein